MSEPTVIPLSALVQRASLGSRLGMAIGLLVLASFVWGVVATFDRGVLSSRHQAERELLVINQLQTDGVTSWREQRFADANALLDDPLLARAVADWQRQASSANTELVLTRLRILQERAKYAAVFLVDTAGQLVLAPSGPPPTSFPEPEFAALKLAIAQARVESVEPRVASAFAFPHFSTLSPLFNGEQAMGAVWLVSDVRSTLFPLLSQWPTTSETAESGLVMRDAQTVVHLSPMRHAMGAELGSSSVLTRTQDPAVQAVLGARGLYEGVDYRSESVIAVASTVPGSPWLLVTKVDRVEVLNDARKREFLTVGLPVLTGLMLLGALFGWVQRRALRREHHLKTELERNLRLLEGAQKAARIGYFAYDIGQQTFIMSHMADAIFGVKGNHGLSRADWLGVLWHQDRDAVLAAHTQAIRQCTPLRIQYRIKRANDQELRWVEVWGEFDVKADTGRAVRMFGTAQDITERKQTEEELAHYRQGLEKTVRLDPLTQISNRRALDEHVGSEWQRAMRSQTALGLLMIDVDNFKAYNDHYGHVGGDRCLQMVAQAIDSSVGRAGELAARYGGEEFAVLVPDTSPEQLLLIAQRIRSAVRALGIAHEKSTTADCVTVSIGAACFSPVFGEPVAVELLFTRADEALYAAKLSGRDSVTIYDAQAT